MEHEKGRSVQSHDNIHIQLSILYNHYDKMFWTKNISLEWDFLVNFPIEKPNIKNSLFHDLCMVKNCDLPNKRITCTIVCPFLDAPKDTPGFFTTLSTRQAHDKKICFESCHGKAA